MNKTYKCEDTGYIGDNGPGISPRLNQEYTECDCMRRVSKEKTKPDKLAAAITRIIEDAERAGRKDETIDALKRILPDYNENLKLNGLEVPA